MIAKASARWFLAWIDPLTPSRVVGPIPVVVASFTPNTARNALSFRVVIQNNGSIAGQSVEDALPAIATTFMLWREQLGIARPARKRFSSSRATIFRSELMGASISVTFDFPEFVVADEQTDKAVGEWLREQVELSATRAFAAIAEAEAKRVKPRVLDGKIVAPPMVKGGARGLLDAMTAPRDEKPNDERAPSVIPAGAIHLSKIAHATPPPDPAPAGSIWIDGSNVYVSVGGGFWIAQGTITVAHAATMGSRARRSL